MSNDHDSDNSKILVEVGGVNLDMLIDSGASCNIIDRETWERLKSMKIKCKSNTQTKKIYAYGSTQPLKVAGTFWSK